MGLKIAELLKWRDEIELKDGKGNPILDNGKPVKVYIRVVGDQDLQEAYKAARIESAAIRRKMRDPDSAEYKDRVEPVDESTDREELMDLIKSARGQNLQAEALSTVERPDEVTIEEVAMDPDAPTLEEQEKVDQKDSDGDEEYKKAIREYIETRQTELNAELEGKGLSELREIAKYEVSNVAGLATFLVEVQFQKAYRGSYTDKQYTQRAFDSIEEFKQTADVIKQQILEKYADLERGPDELKN